MGNKQPVQMEKLFEIVATWNSLRGKFAKGERLTVNLARYVSAGWAQKPYWRVLVTNAKGEDVNSILKTALTRKTALGWAEGNFGHQRADAVRPTVPGGKYLFP